MFYSSGKYKLFVKIMITSVIMLLVFSGTTKGQDVDYRAQSLYVYKFTRYIFWPEEKLSGDFKIGVYGNSEIVDELNLMASLKKGPDGMNITVTEISEDDDLSQYHIIYVPSSKSRQIRELSEKLGDASVLLVAEREGLATKGATISFLVSDNMVLKFEINMSKLEKQDLEISEELLKLGYEI